MAITRRQFVTRLGALAAAMGISQSQLAQMTEAFAYGNFGGGQWNKPKVIWVHGAECTGCSTSVLGLLEDAEEMTEAGVTLLSALSLATGESTSDLLSNYRTRTATANAEDNVTTVDIADVLINFIDLQYHETVMGMGGDIAAQFLKDQMDNADSGGPFVLVVEGAVQDTADGGYWDAESVTGSNPLTGGEVAWCSIGADGTSGATSGATSAWELDFPTVVESLAASSKCLAVVAIGQCATFGGYPACVSPVLREGMTGARGVYDHLVEVAGDTTAAAKVINVPGCPVNPWWFVLTVVAWLIDANHVLGDNPPYTDPPLGVLKKGSTEINPAAVDKDRRLNAVYGYPVHGPYCSRFPYHAKYQYANKPGDARCLYEIGCKGPYTDSMCGYHGWNGQQPRLAELSNVFTGVTKNDDANATLGQNWATNDHGVATQCKQVGNVLSGGHCTTAGAPCKACTERGYPDSWVPFVGYST